MEESSKKFLAHVDAFCVFMVRQGKGTTQNQETTKLISHIAKGLGTIGSAPSGGSAKATIKARLLDSFARKETETKGLYCLRKRKIEMQIYRQGEFADRDCWLIW